MNGFSTPRILSQTDSGATQTSQKLKGRLPMKQSGGAGVLASREAADEPALARQSEATPALAPPGWFRFRKSLCSFVFLCG
jgi:hypothetical protein